VPPLLRHYDKELRFPARGKRNPFDIFLRNFSIFPKRVGFATVGFFSSV
jgi:hypothetical protein